MRRITYVEFSAIKRILDLRRTQKLDWSDDFIIGMVNSYLESNYQFFKELFEEEKNEED